jgi:hypothetical protein
MEIDGPWGADNDDPSTNNTDAQNPGNFDTEAAAAWRERENRQKSIRVLMMFLLMLLIMDGDEQNAANRRHNGLRKQRQKLKNANRTNAFEPAVYQSRWVQDLHLRELVTQDVRYQALIAKNEGRNYESEVLQWAQQQADQEKDLFDQEQEKRPGVVKQEVVPDPEEKHKVFHYPWNTTGFYRGEWTREVKNETSTSTTDNTEKESQAPKVAEKRKPQVLDAVELEQAMIETLKAHKERMGVFLLPDDQMISLRDDHNFTSRGYEGKTMDAAGKMYDPVQANEMTDYDPDTASLLTPPQVTLTHDNGHAAFQLYSRSIPSMKELSLVDGFVKLYDSTSAGYSTRKDILLRVRGVLIHSIGKISLVSNGHLNRSALVIGSGDYRDDVVQAADVNHRRRRLKEALANIDIDTADIDGIREEAVTLFADDVAAKGNKYDWSLASPDTTGMPNRKLLVDSPGATQKESPERNMATPLQELLGLTDDTTSSSREDATITPDEKQSSSSLLVVEQEAKATEPRQLTNLPEAVLVSADKEKPKVASSSREQKSKSSASVARKATEVTEEVWVGRKATEVTEGVSSPADSDRIPRWSDIVIPFPFVRDDKDESIRKVKTQAARRMPSREQKLEANAALCEFEINLNVKEEEWTIGEWRNLFSRRIEEAKKLDPASQPSDTTVEEGTGKRMNAGVTARTKVLQEQALVMKMLGSIHSPNCNFTAHLNATALRTDWDATKGKTINYSFYMMIVCLTQIMMLLRQLLHSQSPSAATRVSLLCVGWQTVIDALICLAHIYFSLAMQPLFSAFASVAFFKLLIFCVIEMKYMAIIIQARNNSNGGESTEVLRRQVAMLHLRFYVALFGAMLLMFYAFDRYRTLFMLVLYSFWVPQIVMNVVTEAKNPMHQYYIYGMSITRLFVPLYVFAVRDNFLKEVWPDTAVTDTFTCQLVVLWVGLQTFILIGQGKYGARFMIPARCLPPKFDYSRPLPASMLPPGFVEIQHTDALAESSPFKTSLSESQALLDEVSTSRGRTRHPTATTTRNRIRGKRANLTNRTESMTSEAVDSIKPSSPCTHDLDCSICYDGIDIRDRPAYMLAPCDHIFHRDCLVQWMDVKMEW